MKRSPSWIQIALASSSALLLHGVACTPSRVDDRPSFLLIVVDTLRADAVSAYGAVDGTTPNLDALAADGLRYTRAFAPSPWTLPSHATILTGLSPEQHGVGYGGKLVLPEGTTTLAEQMAEAGYETIGFTENPIVAQEFGFARGFSHFEGELVASQALAMGKAEGAFDILLVVSAWADQRDEEKPFFTFINLFEVHDPYEYQEDHLFFPPNADHQRAKQLRTGGERMGVVSALGICDRLPSSDDVALVRGLYLGGVAATDVTLGTIHRRLVEATPGRRLVTIVTSDHGEHLGEKRLLGHEFSLRNEVLQVPLVVHGLPNAAPAVIEAPVGLANIAPSILAWAGIEAQGELPEVPIVNATPPLSPTRKAVFSDAPLTVVQGVMKKDHQRTMKIRRRGCAPKDRVFGDMLSIIDFPWKLIWYQNTSPQLYDLSWDHHERSDVSNFHPEIVARLEKELTPLRGQLQASGSSEEVDPALLDKLRSLGYAD